LFKLPQNTAIKTTIFRVVSFYIITTILLISIISYMYLSNQKKQIFQLQQNRANNIAKIIINKLEILHNNIDKEIAIYPEFEDIKSGIYDIDKKLIFKNFIQDITIKNQKYFIQNGFIYFIYPVEPYYLGTAFLVIQQKQSGKFYHTLYNVIAIMFIVIFFLSLTSFLLIKLLIKPLSNNYLLLDKFIKDTTHELNTPVSAILINTQLIDKTNLDEKNQKRFNRIEIGAKTISSIYEDLAYLLLNKQEKSNNTNLNISNILQTRIEYFEILFQNKSLKIQCDIQEDIFKNGDEIKIQRLFDNLLSNAIKYSYPNTTITITLNNQYFMIKDQGIGLYEDEIKEIFIRYKRFDKNNGGFGLGYSIIKSIINEYNFKIEITSQKNQWTKVKIIW